MGLETIIGVVRPFAYSLAVATALAGCTQPRKVELNESDFARLAYPVTDEKEEADTKANDKVEGLDGTSTRTATAQPILQDKAEGLDGTPTRPEDGTLTAQSAETPIPLLESQSETPVTKTAQADLDFPDSIPYGALNKTVAKLVSAYTLFAPEIKRLRADYERLNKDYKVAYAKLGEIEKKIDEAKADFEKKLGEMQGKLGSPEAYERAAKSLEEARKLYEPDKTFEGRLKTAEGDLATHEQSIEELRSQLTDLQNRLGASAREAPKSSERVIEPAPAPVTAPLPETPVPAATETSGIQPSNSYDVLRNHGKQAYLDGKLNAVRYSDFLREVEAEKNPDEIRSKYLGGTK